MHECSLSPLTEPAAKGECVWCGSGLKGRQRRWCGKGCVDTFLRNHEWGAARLEAGRRSSITVRQPGGEWRRPQCDQCGIVTSAIEINHVEPRVGRGYGKGCWNHQTNLQALCHDCHVAETARQRRERACGIWPGFPLRDPPTWTKLFASWKAAERYIETGRLLRDPEPAPDQIDLGLVG